MDSKDLASIGPRQREILEVIIRLGHASVTEIIENLSESPTPGAIRRMLKVLQDKGLLICRQDGPRKIYSPGINRELEREKALGRVVETFFSGSALRTMASLLKSDDVDMSDEDKKTIMSLIEKAKERE